MSLTEKSLELNITHELLSRADALWHALHFAYPGPMLGSAHGNRHALRLPARLSPPVAFGLTLTDELRSGWDVKIGVPDMTGRLYALFLQFKRAKPMHFSSKKSSHFRGSNSLRKRKPHCVFGVNNNSGKDQHVVLCSLARRTHRATSVIYALPRLPTTQAMCRWIGSLVHMTSFVDVLELDQLATSAGVSIAVGQEHAIAVSYDGVHKEVRSEPVHLTGLRDQGESVLADVFDVRVHRAVSRWREAVLVYDDSDAVNWDGWVTIFDRFLYSIGLYFGLDVDAFSEIDDNFRLPDGAKDEMRRSVTRLVDLAMSESADNDSRQQTTSAYGAEAVLATAQARGMAVIERLKKYRALFRVPTELRNAPVPEPKTECAVDTESVELSDKGGEESLACCSLVLI